jgi:nitroreductase
MTNALTMFVETAIYGRRAVRAYTAQPVARETIEQLIDAAIQAPSSMDLEPWAFVVIEGVARLKGFSDRAKAAFVPGPMTGAAAEHFRNMLVDPAFNIFHDASALIVVCATSEAGQAVEDCSLAAQNLMLAAHAAGLGTCPIGFSRPWLRLAETKRELGIDLQFVPAFPLVVGYPAEHPVAPGRKKPRIIAIS